MAATLSISQARAMPSEAQFEQLLDEVFAESGAFPCSTERETGAFLASLIRLFRPRRVLELGTFMGATTIQLIRALPFADEPRVVTVDCADLRSAALRKLDPFYSFMQGQDIAVLPALRGSFDFIYLDTIHTCEHTKAQVAAIRATNPRALLAVHDVYSHPAVADGLMDFSDDYNLLTFPTPPQPDGRVNGLAILAPKTGPARI